MGHCSETLTYEPPSLLSQNGIVLDIWAEIIQYLTPTPSADLLAVALTSKHLSGLALPSIWRVFRDNTQIVHVVNASVPEGETKYLELVGDKWALQRQLPQSLCERVQLYLSYIQHISITPLSPDNIIWSIISLAIRSRYLLPNVSILSVDLSSSGGDYSDTMSNGWMSLITLLSTSIKVVYYTHARIAQQLIPIHALLLAQMSYRYPYQLSLAFTSNLDRSDIACLLGDTPSLSLTCVDSENFDGILEALSLALNLTELDLTASFEESLLSYTHQSQNPPAQKYCLHKLTTLRFSFIEPLALELFALLECPGLLKLDLISDAAHFKYLVKAGCKFPQLQSLKCKSNTKLSQTDIKPMLLSKNLASLSLTGESQLTEYDIIDILSALPHLQSLKIKGSGSVPLPPSILFTITRMHRQPFKFLSLPLDLTVDASQSITRLSPIQSCPVQEFRFSRATRFPTTSAGKMKAACFLRAAFSAFTPLITPLFGVEGVSEPLTDIYDTMCLIARAKYGYVI